MLLQEAQFIFGTNQQLMSSTTSLSPTKPEDPSSRTQSTSLHTIPHHSHTAEIMTPLLFKIHVNITSY